MKSAARVTAAIAAVTNELAVLTSALVDELNKEIGPMAGAIFRERSRPVLDRFRECMDEARLLGLIP